MALKVLILEFATIYSRKCGLPLMACQKIFRSFVREQSVFLPLCSVLTAAFMWQCGKIMRQTVSAPDSGLFLPFPPLAVIGLKGTENLLSCTSYPPLTCPWQSFVAKRQGYMAKHSHGPDVAAGGGRHRKAGCLSHPLGRDGTLESRTPDPVLARARRAHALLKLAPVHFSTLDTAREHASMRRT